MNQTRVVASWDGTRLHVESLAGGPGAPVLLCNAIGADRAMWHRILPELSRDRPVITWSYRGLHGSDEPVTERLDAGAHAEDAIAVLDDAGIDRALSLAWSSGGPVGVQLAHDHPERIVGLALVCATIGNAGRLLRHLEIAGLLPFLAGVGKYFHEPVHGLFRSLVGRAEIAGLVRQSGFIGPATDVAAVVQFLQELASCNARWLMRVYEGVAREGYHHLLDEIHCPALVVGGARDRWTTPRMTNELAANLPRATTKMYDAGTHFLPVEYPDELVRDLNDFFTAAAPA